jgi:hypothetical protein
MFYSEQVKTVFSAIYSTANQLGAKASAAQGRDVTKHFSEIVSLMCTTLILGRPMFSTNNVKLSYIVARSIEVCDGRGRMAKESICANS